MSQLLLRHKALREICQGQAGKLERHPNTYPRLFQSLGVGEDPHPAESLLEALNPGPRAPSPSVRILFDSGRGRLECQEGAVAAQEECGCYRSQASRDETPEVWSENPKPWCLMSSRSR